MRLLMRVVRWVANLAFMSLLLGLVAILAANRLWKLDFRTVLSGSMERTIPVGSVVVVRPVKTATIRPGDVVTFKLPEKPSLIVTHRVVEAFAPAGGTDTFRTKGDANASEDLELVPAQNVLGRAVFHVPYVGYLAQFARSRPGWLLLMVAPAFILVLIELVSVLKTIWATDKQPKARELPSEGV